METTSLYQNHGPMPQIHRHHYSHRHRDGVKSAGPAIRRWKPTSTIIITTKRAVTGLCVQGVDLSTEVLTGPPELPDLEVRLVSLRFRPTRTLLECLGTYGSVSNCTVTPLGLSTSVAGPKATTNSRKYLPNPRCTLTF